LSSIALLTSNTSNYFAPLLQTDISTGLSSIALFTSNTSNYLIANAGGPGLSSLLGDVSTGLSSIALFTSNTSNYLAANAGGPGLSSLLGDVSSGLSSIALFTSNTSNYLAANAGGPGLSSLLGDVSTGLSSIALFTSNTSNYLIANAGGPGLSSLLGLTSSGLSTVALFTSNTSNYLMANAGGPGLSSLLGDVSSGLSSIALLTSNTSNYFITNATAQGTSSIFGQLSSGLSTIATFTSNTSNYYNSLLNLDISTTLVSVVASYATIFGLSTTQAVSTSRAILYYLSTAINTPVNAAATVFYLNNSVPNGSNGSLQQSQTTGAYQTIETPIAGNTSNIFIKGFKFDFSLPSFIPAGIWDLNLFAFDTNSATQVYASLYKYNEVSLVETFIATSSNAPDLLNNEDIAQYDLTFNVPYTNLATTDSLILKIYANNTSVNPDTVTTYYEGFYYSHLHTSFGTIIPALSLTSTVQGLGSAGYISTAQYNLLVTGASTIASFTSNTSNYYSALFLTDISSGLSTIGIFTSNVYDYILNNAGTGGGISPLQLTSTTDGLGLIYISTGGGGTGTGNLNTVNLTSTVAGLGTAQYASTSYVFLSNSGTTTNFPQFITSPLTTLITQENLSTVADAITSTVVGLNLTGYIGAGQGTSSLTGDLSSVALFTSNTSNYFTNFLQDVSTPISTVAAFTSNYATAISNYYVQPFSFDISTPYSTLGNFTSNTSNYFLQTAGGAGVSSLLGTVSSGFSTLAAFTSNTSNSLISLYETSITSSIDGLGTIGYISTASLQSTVTALQVITITAIGFPSTLNGLAQVGQFSTLNYVRIQPTSNIWVAAGTDATFTLKNSLDGINWLTTNGSFATSGNGIAYNGSIWVAAGQDTIPAGSIKYSLDGTNFNNSLTGGFSGYGSGIAWNGYQWIAVGSDTTNTIQRSSDGINWFSVISGQFTNYGSAVAWNSYQWVAVGSDATTSMKSSIDGLTWLNATSGGFTGPGRGIAWNGSIWVAVGTDTATTIKYSLDGRNWIASSNGFTSSGAAVAWNGRMFVSVGTDSTPGNTIKYSFNGQVWSNAGTGFATAGNGISWNGYIWLAVGEDSTAAGSLKYSFDGLVWANSASGGFTGVGKGVAWSSNTTPSFSQATLDILPQGVPLFFRSTNQIFAQPSSLLINNTAQIDLFYKRVGINCNAPQYTLDVFGAARVSSLFIGNLSTQNTIQFYGNTGGFTNTVIAELSSGSTTQELLLFRGSSIGDQIRMQTTGNIVFEAGAPARTFPNSGQLSTPSMVITSYGSVAIGYSTPSYTLDVAGSARFLGNVVMGAMFVGVAFL
jgi:hypothetical protein